MRSSRAIRWLAAAVVTWISGWILFDLSRHGWIAVAIIGNALLLPIWAVAVFHLIPPNLKHPLLHGYFAPKSWERGGSFYLQFGVLRIQALLEKLGLEKLSGRRPRGFRVRRDEVFIEKMEWQTRAAEAAHGLCFLVMVGLAGYTAIIGNVSGFGWLIGSALAFQVPAVILQRYNRPRWCRLLSRLSARVERNRIAGSEKAKSSHASHRV